MPSCARAAAGGCGWCPPSHSPFTSTVSFSPAPRTTSARSISTSCLRPCKFGPNCRVGIAHHVQRLVGGAHPTRNQTLNWEGLYLEFQAARPADVHHEDLAVADTACAGGADNAVGHLLNALVAHPDADL